MHLRFLDLQSPMAEQATVRAVAKDVSNVSITKGICHHCRKHHAEESWSHQTVLLYSSGEGKGVGVLSVTLHPGLHVIVKLPIHRDKLGGTSKLGHGLPQPPPPIFYVSIV